MKTTTITVHAANNYGAYLQAFALQKALVDKLRIKNDILNYQAPAQKRHYKVIKFPRSVDEAVKDLLGLMHYSALKKRFNRFEKARREFLSMTVPCDSEEKAYSIAAAYDAAVCGSDQIWNTRLLSYSDIYFMADYKGRKIAYAPSFGPDVERIDKERALRLVRDFDMLSVREKQGSDFLAENGFKNVRTVCDPTILLEKNDYKELIGKTEIGEPYMLFYTINYNERVLALVKKLSEKLGLTVYTPFSGFGADKAKKYGIKIIYDAGPREFLSLINNAEYVCSNSFHGTVFSAVLEKQYFRLGEWDEENGSVKRDERIDGFLDSVGVENRAVYERNGELVVPDGRIDYSQVEKKLASVRDEGLGYLRECFKTEA